MTKQPISTQNEYIEWSTIYYNFIRASEHVERVSSLRDMSSLPEKYSGSMDEMYIESLQNLSSASLNLAESLKKSKG